MKVLFLSWAYPKSFTPYLGLWAHQQARALNLQGVDVEVIHTVPYIPKFLSFTSIKMKKYAEIPKKEHLDGIQVYYSKNIRLKPYGKIDNFMYETIDFWVKKQFQKIKKEIEFNKYSIIHAHNIFPDGLLAYYISQEYNIPYVLTFHDFDRYNSIPLKGYNKYLANKIINNSSHNICVSSKVRNNIYNNLINKNVKLEVLLNTYETKESMEFENNERQISRKIVTIGSLIERKGIRYLLYAFQKVLEKYPNMELVIIGSGELEVDLKLLAKKLNIFENVSFKGVLNHEDTMEILKESFLFCLPSWDEAFGVVYAEAMSFGIPVIGCMGEGIEDLVVHRKNGLLVLKKNIESLYGEIVFLLDNEKTALEIGKQGKKDVRELRLDSFGQKLLKIYYEVLK